jgi:hypothetical protein
VSVSRNRNEIWSVLICESHLPYVDTCLHTREREDSSYSIRNEDSELPSHTGLPGLGGKVTREESRYTFTGRDTQRSQCSSDYLLLSRERRTS